MWNVKHKSDSSNRGNWNNLKIIQEIPERHNGKAHNQGITENSRIGRCTHTAGNANVKYKTFNMGNNITCGMNWNCRIAATFYTLEAWFVPGV
jgi:hypothetical protein